MVQSPISGKRINRQPFRTVRRRLKHAARRRWCWTQATSSSNYRNEVSIVFPIDIHTLIIMQWTLEERHIEYLGVERRIEPLLFSVANASEKHEFFALSLACFLSVAYPIDDI